MPLATPLSESYDDDGGVSLGPELAPSITSGWTLTGAPAPTQDGTGIHFSSAANIAAATIALAALADNTTYQIVFTVANFVGGAVRVLCYGDTTAHLGATPSVSADGVHSYQVTTNATGSLTDTLRVQATGASGTNTFDITSLSVKQVL